MNHFKKTSWRRSGHSGEIMELICLRVVDVADGSNKFHLSSAPTST